MKTQYYTASSLDGFIATPDHSLDWLFPLADINQSSYPEFIAQIGAIAMGASTYEWIMRNSDAVAAETGSAWPYTQPVWVFTHRELPAITENIYPDWLRYPGKRSTVISPVGIKSCNEIEISATNG